MSYAFYRCSEDCDGKPCFLVYPLSENVPPPKLCVVSRSECKWNKVELNQLIEEALGANGGKGPEVNIEFEKLRLIAEYFEFPVAVFLTPVEELRKLKGRTLSEDARRAFRKLERIREILEEDEP